MTNDEFDQGPIKYSENSDTHRKLPKTSLSERDIMSLQWKFGIESRRDEAGSIFGENVLEGHPTKGETAIAYEDSEFLTLEKADYKACVHQTLVYFL
jgi:hypothetical protein